jgi:hypothetical protein
MVRVTAGPTGTCRMVMSDCRSHRYTSDGERTEQRLYDKLMSDGRSHRHTTNGERTMRRFMMKCRSSLLGCEFPGVWRLASIEGHSSTGKEDWTSDISGEGLGSSWRRRFKLCNIRFSLLVPSNMTNAGETRQRSLRRHSTPSDLSRAEGSVHPQWGLQLWR